MSAAFYVLALLAGWCGSDNGRRPPIGPDPPDPDPDPWIPALLALIGGLVGGWVINRSFGSPEMGSAVRALLVFVGGYMGGMILNDIRKIPGRFKQGS